MSNYFFVTWRWVGSARYFLLNSSCWSLESLCQGVGSVKAGRPSCWSSNSWLRASLWPGLRLSLPRSRRSASGTPCSSSRLVSPLSLSVGPSYWGIAGKVVVEEVLTVVVKVDAVVEVVVVVVVVVVDVVVDDG